LLDDGLEGTDTHLGYHVSLNSGPVSVPVPVPVHESRQLRRSRSDRRCGSGSRELDVYHLSLDFLVFANELIEGLPRGRSHLADQLTRASTSIVLNLAEGAGKHSRPDKRRDYLTARGSATDLAGRLS
jgi:hypothetical protein